MKIYDTQDGLLIDAGMLLNFRKARPTQAYSLAFPRGIVDIVVGKIIKRTTEKGREIVDIFPGKDNRIRFSFCDNEGYHEYEKAIKYSKRKPIVSIHLRHKNGTMEVFIAPVDQWYKGKETKGDYHRPLL